MYGISYQTNGNKISRIPKPGIVVLYGDTAQAVAGWYISLLANQNSAGFNHLSNGMRSGGDGYNGTTTTTGTGFGNFVFFDGHANGAVYQNFVAASEAQKKYHFAVSW